ncbi:MULTISPECIES: helix-turn-helix transcriptional regulator [Glutamicibacter]|uniref:helix-turn-helix transcriptional regulator n=1 Tax=Glutamicibacter TaxID=1742989 RepID=UPI003F9292F6
MTTQASLEKLLTIDEYCEWRGISKGAAAQERYRGTGPQFIKAGKQIRYTVSSIQAWLEQQTRDRT